MPSGKLFSCNFDFFFKTDDDATLCIAQLVKDLRAAPKGASVYAGAASRPDELSRRASRSRSV